MERRSQALRAQLSTSARVLPIGPVPAESHPVGHRGAPSAVATSPKESHRVFEFSPHNVAADRVRGLLRKLRDLNLSAETVAITHSSHVTIAGCLSLDAPAESGVRYRLFFSDGAQAVLELGSQASGLALSVNGRSTHVAERSLSVRLSCDREGRVCARELAARVSPETCDPRALARFLKRAVRTLYRER